MATSLLTQTNRAPAPAHTQPQRATGSLVLEFKRDPVLETTVLSASAQQPPLRIVRPFPLSNGSVLVHLHNVSGGLLGGDHLLTSVNVGSGASVQLTTTGATRVYRCLEDREAALQVNRFTIATDGLLEYVPDAIIPFAKSRFRQETTVDIEMGGGLFWWEILAPGREARGEVFAYDSVELKTELKVPGRPISAENVRLQPANRDLRSTARLGPYRYWITFYIVRVGVEPNSWLAAEQKLREVVSRFAVSGEALWGVSTLAAHGLVVRGLTRRGSGILASLRAVWNEAKLLLYGCEAIPPRKIN